MRTCSCTFSSSSRQGGLLLDTASGGEAAEKAVNTNFVKIEGFDCRVKHGSCCRHFVYSMIRN